MTTEPPKTKPKDDSSSDGANRIAWAFLHQYYGFLNKDPSKLHCFYTKRSTLIHSTEGEEPQPCYGQHEIHDKIMSLNLSDCKVFISNVDSQSSAEGGIIVQVIGEMANPGVSGGPTNHWRKFAQTFFLAEQPNGYFVLNDICRYMREEVIDELQQPLPSSSSSPPPSSSSALEYPSTTNHFSPPQSTPFESAIDSSSSSSYNYPTFHHDQPQPLTNGNGHHHEQFYATPQQNSLSEQPIPFDIPPPVPTSPEYNGVENEVEVPVQELPKAAVEEEKEVEPVPEPAVEEEEPAPVPVVEEEEIPRLPTSAPPVVEKEPEPVAPVVEEPVVEPSPPAPTPTPPPPPPAVAEEPAVVSPPAPAPAPAPVTTPVVPPTPAAPVKKSWASLVALSAPKKTVETKPSVQVVAPVAAAVAPTPVATSSTPAAPPAGSTPAEKFHPNVMSVTHCLCFVKGVIETVSDESLRKTLEDRFGALKEFDIIRNKACAFVEFETLLSARKAIQVSMRQNDGGEGGIWVPRDGGDGQDIINVVTRKEKGDRPVTSGVPGPRSQGQRGGYTGGQGGQGGRGPRPSAAAATGNDGFFVVPSKGAHGHQGEGEGKRGQSNGAKSGNNNSGKGRGGGQAGKNAANAGANK